jgi:hypothetical protein
MASPLAAGYRMTSLPGGTDRVDDGRVGEGFVEGIRMITQGFERRHHEERFRLVISDVSALRSS